MNERPFLIDANGLWPEHIINFALSRLKQAQRQLCLLADQVLVLGKVASHQVGEQACYEEGHCHRCSVFCWQVLMDRRLLL